MAIVMSAQQAARVTDFKALPQMLVQMLVHIQPAHLPQSIDFERTFHTSSFARMHTFNALAHFARRPATAASQPVSQSERQGFCVRFHITFYGRIWRRTHTHTHIARVEKGHAPIARRTQNLCMR